VTGAGIDAPGNAQPLNSMNTAVQIRRLLPLAAAVLGVLLGGCVIKSVYPFYTAKDVVFDPVLPGKWSENGGPADDDHWKFDRLGDKAYWLTTIGKSETNGFEAHLFRLKQHTFLDFCPTNRDEGRLPLHYFLKVEQLTPTLKFRLMKPDWLEKLLEKDPKALRHMFVPAEPGKSDRMELILTADTKELQEFILKHVGDTNAFTDVTEMKKWK